MLDVAIIGSGPAALSAALYLARAGVKAKIFERAALGGELSQIAELSNYPGFTGTGKVLADAMWSQAESAGAEFTYGECEQIRVDGKSAKITVDGEEIICRTVLVATGSNPKQLNFKPSAPVSYCALCDGELAKGKKIAVIGGANAAVSEALYLAPLVERLTLITHSQLKADDILQQQLRQVSNVEIIENLEPTAENLSAYDYIFVCIGRTPATSFLSDLNFEEHVSKKIKLTSRATFSMKIDRETRLLDKKGYIVTGQSDADFKHQTAFSRIFAAGDVRAGMPAQVITAAGDGAAAAIEIVSFLRQNS